MRTDTGPVRPHNEDAAFATPRLAAVADGVGGHAAGEVASRTVVGVLASLEKAWVDEPLDAALARAVADGNDRIAFLMECRPETAGMGTTLTAVALHEDYVVANIGDSRTYLLRDGELRRLTRDDSYLQELLDAGVVSPEDARRHPQRNLVTAALDGAPGRAPAITAYPRAPATACCSAPTASPTRSTSRRSRRCSRSRTRRAPPTRSCARRWRPARATTSRSSWPTPCRCRARAVGAAGGAG